MGGGGGVSLTFGAHTAVTPVHHHVFWEVAFEICF